MPPLPACYVPGGGIEVTVAHALISRFNFCRTNIFMKEHKQYSNVVLVIALIVFLILGAYTWTPVSQVEITDLCMDWFSRCFLG